MPAIGRQAGNHRIADRHRADLAADRLDDARRLVPRNGGQGMRIGAVDKMQIRMAQPAGGRPDQHFMRSRFGDDDVLDNERLARFDQYCCLHFLLLAGNGEIS